VLYDDFVSFELNNSPIGGGWGGFHHPANGPSVTGLLSWIKSRFIP
jgi:hypothetical protein